MSSKRRHSRGNYPLSPAADLAQKTNAQAQQIRSAFYSGPLPPAAELERYEKVRPGLAERIVRMAERQIEMAEGQMKHRHALEIKVISTNARLSYLGLLSGFMLGSGGLGAAVYLIRLGKEMGGGAAFVASLATLAGLFLYGRKRQEKQLEERLKGPK